MAPLGINKIHDVTRKSEIHFDNKSVILLKKEMYAILFLFENLKYHCTCIRMTSFLHKQHLFFPKRGPSSAYFREHLAQINELSTNFFFNYNTYFKSNCFQINSLPF